MGVRVAGPGEDGHVLGPVLDPLYLLAGGDRVARLQLQGDENRLVFIHVVLVLKWTHERWCSCGFISRGSFRA